MFEEQLGGELYLKGRSIYKEVIKILPVDSWVHYSQCIKAAGSIVANIAEGNGRNSGKGGYYRQFLQMARGSAYETLAWIQVGIIDGKIPAESEKRIGELLINLGELLLIEILNKG